MRGVVEQVEPSLSTRVGWGNEGLMRIANHTGRKQKGERKHEAKKERGGGATDSGSAGNTKYIQTRVNLWREVRVKGPEGSEGSGERDFTRRIHGSYRTPPYVWSFDRRLSPSHRLDHDPLPWRLLRLPKRQRQLLGFCLGFGCRPLG